MMPNSLPLVTLDQEFKNKKFFQFWLSLVAVRRRPMKTRFHKFVILLPFVLTPIRTTAFFFILLKGYVLQAYPIAPYFVFAFPLLASVRTRHLSSVLRAYRQAFRRSALFASKKQALDQRIHASSFRLRLAGKSSLHSQGKLKGKKIAVKLLFP